MFTRKYQCISPLGQGKFGEVYEGIHRKTGERVAIKIECHSQQGILRHESTLLHYLSTKSCRHVPSVYWYGEWTERDAMALVMPLYEYSLYEYVTRGDAQPQSYVEILASCLRVYESIHATGVVHRDVKPQNLMCKSRQWYVIDFGLSTFYVDEHYRPMAPSIEPILHLVGTPKYVSWFAHQGYDTTRRDDVLSLGYVGLWMLYGERFWEIIAPDEYAQVSVYSAQDGTDLRSPKNQRLARCKEKMRVLKVDCPSLRNYFECAYSLGFQETPRYREMEQCLVEPSQS